MEDIEIARNTKLKKITEIAEKLNVKRSTYAGWECGKDIIPLRKLNDFANLFHDYFQLLISY